MNPDAAGKPNRLIHESSPYLLQHARNPVDWHPWDETALALAKREDRPILLSVGYSACHWCHVMERESFEDPEIAEAMNQRFVNIKVDREERPDIDAIYMNYVQMTTGSGGWPLTVFLTPSLVPFFGGTYFPPHDRYGRPGFKRVLESVHDAYRNRRDELERMSPQIVQRLRQAADFDVPEGETAASRLDEAQRNLADQFDRRHGGFGSAPKFPAAMALGFLLRHHRRSGSASSLEMAETSLRKMARGGVYDQLGGGFHRYSVDDVWLVPHFEKMLYDNALLARLYVQAYQATGKTEYRRVAEETLGYLRREMTDPEGGFYSAQDADSEGVEGKFYVWSLEEIEQALGAEEASLFAEYYGVTRHGNFEGENILHRPFELEAVAQSAGLDAPDLEDRLARSRQKLLQIRASRVKPGLDDKVLAAWNGMALAAFSEAAFALESHDFLESAVRNAEFLSRHMIREGRLHRTWKAGQARLNGYLEDYAAVAEGFLNLFEAGGGARWLAEAERLTAIQFELFHDPERGDFYFTPSDHERLLVRQKEHLDNATPSGNSVTCMNLLRLAELTGKAVYRERAERLLRLVAAAVPRHPLAFGYWLQAFDFCVGPVAEFVVVGPEEGRSALLAPLRKVYRPNKVVVQSEGPGAADAPQIPLLEGKSAVDGRAAVYVCQDFACQPPCSDPAEFAARLHRQ